jgi:capsid protein
MNIHTPTAERRRMFVLGRASIGENPITCHAPRVDPLRLTSATIQAVDRIGEAAAEEINEAASELMRNAGELAAALRELAEDIKERSRIAHEQVALFCDQATSLLDAVRSIHAARVEKIEPKAGIEEAQDDIPTFLKQGPADFEGQKA